MQMLMKIINGVVLVWFAALIIDHVEVEMIKAQTPIACHFEWPHGRICE